MEGQEAPTPDDLMHCTEDGGSAGADARRPEVRRRRWSASRRRRPTIRGTAPKIDELPDTRRPVIQRRKRRCSRAGTRPLTRILRRRRSSCRARELDDHDHASPKMYALQAVRLRPTTGIVAPKMTAWKWTRHVIQIQLEIQISTQAIQQYKLKIVERLIKYSLLQFASERRYN